MARSIKKGPFVEERLLKRVEAAKTSGRLDMIRTFSRSSVIIPDMVNMTISVYNGKTWIPVYITENLVGHKLGEFAPTRVFRGHTHDDSSAKKSSASSAAPAPSAAPAAASAPAPSAEA